ncbi:uncharacterized protein [Prorops nasuta]|uniref:uncharacterized protein n=1 Tax=Prorops nasuta TaxID=863751 RepID=UPI0034CF3BA7
MTERVKLLIQKRITLKSQITNLTNILDKGQIDNASIKLRIGRLTSLYHTFKESFDELMVLDPQGIHQSEFDFIQERFYALAARIENLLADNRDSNASCSGSHSHIHTSGSSASNSASQAQLVKLPQISLPVFNGRYEEWLTFKNAFRSIIDARTDISELDKLHYLKSALVDEAAKKIAIFSVSSANYKKAWVLLERSYEIKRILISKHISSIFNLPVLDKETTRGFSQLADDMQQHIASLETLGVHVTSEIAEHLLETRLPKTIMNQWEASLSRETYPELDTMYEFLYKCAVSASRRERTRPHDDDKDKRDTTAKKRPKLTHAQAFTTNTSQSCIACKGGPHPLFRCEAFKKLSVKERFNLVKKAKLCYNCFRSHRGKPCKLSSCTVCAQNHNTLLHFETNKACNTEDSAEQKSEPKA